MSMEEFQRRVVDRRLRDSYERQFRIVVPDQSVTWPAESSPTRPAPRASVPDETGRPDAERPSWLRRWGWIGLIVVVVALLVVRTRRSR
jgi:hypothetical protein